MSRVTRKQCPLEAKKQSQSGAQEVNPKASYSSAVFEMLSLVFRAHALLDDVSGLTEARGRYRNVLVAVQNSWHCGQRCVSPEFEKTRLAIVLTRVVKQLAQKG